MYLNLEKKVFFLIYTYSIIFYLILFCRIIEKWWICYSIKCREKEIIDIVEVVRLRVIINLLYWGVGDLFLMLSVV